MNTDQKQLDWQKLMRKKFTANEALIIAVNLIPLFGVWFWNWDAKEMFLVYCLESVVVGLYTIVQMLIVTYFKKTGVWNDKTGAMMPGLFFVFFFIFHFGLFLFVQMSIFLSIVKYPGLSDFGSASTFILHFPKYLSGDAMLVLLSFVFSYGVVVTRRFFFTGEYKNAKLGVIMFTPYPRIFVQQFVVIIGSFFLMFGDGATKIFMLIFVLVKLFFEVRLDFDKLFEQHESLSFKSSSVNDN